RDAREALRDEHLDMRGLADGRIAKVAPEDGGQHVIVRHDDDRTRHWKNVQRPRRETHPAARPGLAMRGPVINAVPALITGIINGTAQGGGPPPGRFSLLLSPFACRPSLS